METSPVTCHTLEEFYHIDGHTFEKQYKEVLSGFRQWEQLEHADEWLLFPDNIGPCLAIDESSLSNGELYTFVTNREARTREQSLVAVVAGTKAEDVEAPAFRLINRVFNIRRKLHIGYSRKISDALSLLYSGVKYILHFKIQRGSNCLHTPYNTYRYLWPNSPYASLSTQSLASDRTYKPTCEVLTVILRTRSIDFNLSILYSSSCFPSDFP